MVDLNSLIAPGSNLELTFAFAINDPGEIVGIGVPSGCGNIDFCGHAYVLIPCAEDDGGRGDKAEDDGAIQSGRVSRDSVVTKSIQRRRCSSLPFVHGRLIPLSHSWSRSLATKPHFRSPTRLRLPQPTEPLEE